MWERTDLKSKSKKWLKEEVDWLKWHIESHMTGIEEDTKDIKLLKKELKKRGKSSGNGLDNRRGVCGRIRWSKNCVEPR